MKKFLGYFRDLTTTGSKKLFSELTEGDINGVALFADTPQDTAGLRIVAAANRYPNDVIVVSARHHDKLMNQQLRALKASGIIESTHTQEQGFIDNQGMYHTREEALEIARRAGQLNVIREKTFPETMLFSEDLY
ncbi:hypothetical protein DEEACLCL_00096 [Salmonella phage CRW-SP2]|nr:hypothetical protein DEEACLCL_00096 [Salmonella phage CRW-SP2]